MGLLQSSSREREQERYRAFIEHSSEGIWCLEFDQAIPVDLSVDDQVALIEERGRISEANEALASLLGVENTSNVVHHPIQVAAPVSGAELRDTLRSFVLHGYRLADRECRAGGNRMLLVSLSGIVQCGLLRRIWGTERDVTERQQMAEQLRQSQKMEAIGQLAGGVAHDFNNLLTAILGYGEMVRGDLGAEHPCGADVEQILNAGRRAESLTRQLLAFSRKQLLEPEVLSLSDVAGSFEPMLRRLIDETVRIELSLEPGLWRTHVDRGQIEQVIMNLAVNARDAMPQGGVLTIQTSNVVLDEDYVRAHPLGSGGRHVCLAVSDTGVGMHPDVRARIFEPFFTTKGESGTGLGLSTAYGIVQQSGGQILVYSEPGLGTTFKIYLPAVEAGSETPVAAESSDVPGGSETILVVEDDDTVRELSVDALKRLGYQILAAGSAEEALGVMDRYSDPIHLLITDVVMPGLSGPELAEILTTCRHGLRVVFTSGYPPSAARPNRAELRTNQVFLQKPYSFRALARAVRELLDRSASNAV